jgi:hypothetical protein
MPKLYFKSKGAAKKAAKDRKKTAYTMPDGSIFVGTYQEAQQRKQGKRTSMRNRVVSKLDGMDGKIYHAKHSSPKAAETHISKLRKRGADIKTAKKAGTTFIRYKFND